MDWPVSLGSYRPSQLGGHPMPRGGHERLKSRYWSPYFRDAVYSHRDHEYPVKHFREKPDNVRSGLGEGSVWLYKRDLLALIRRAGFERMSVLGKDVHPGLPHITILADAA